MIYFSEFEPDFQDNRRKFHTVVFIFIIHFYKSYIRNKISFDSLENRVRTRRNVSYSNYNSLLEFRINDTKFINFGHVSETSMELSGNCFCVRVGYIWSNTEKQLKPIVNTHFTNPTHVHTNTRTNASASRWTKRWTHPQNAHPQTHTGLPGRWNKLSRTQPSAFLPLPVFSFPVLNARRVERGSRA